MKRKKRKLTDKQKLAITFLQMVGFGIYFIAFLELCEIFKQKERLHMLKTVNKNQFYYYMNKIDYAL